MNVVGNNLRSLQISESQVSRLFNFPDTGTLLTSQLTNFLLIPLLGQPAGGRL